MHLLMAGFIVGSFLGFFVGNIAAELRHEKRRPDPKDLCGAQVAEASQ